MKTLYIARHADALIPHLMQSDIDRPLSHHGQSQAAVIAAYLLRRDVHPDRILSSPALRTITTAKIYHERLDSTLQADDRIYEASTNTLLYLVQEAWESNHTLMIVGHNPGISELIQHLSDTPTPYLPPAGVVGLEFEGAITAGSGKRFLYVHPDQVRSM